MPIEEMNLYFVLDYLVKNLDIDEETAKSLAFEYIPSIVEETEPIATEMLRRLNGIIEEIDSSETVNYTVPMFSIIDNSAFDAGEGQTLVLHFRKGAGEEERVKLGTVRIHKSIEDLTQHSAIHTHDTVTLEYSMKYRTISVVIQSVASCAYGYCPDDINLFVYKEERIPIGTFGGE